MQTLKDHLLSLYNVHAIMLLYVLFHCWPGWQT